MSDLCHNCGDCHLGSHPTPCLKALSECIICKNYGHTFNFCPFSVRIVDKEYQYWMLCHNCDRWHLPRPCDHNLVTCQNCSNIGHLPSFCPLRPDARMRPLGDSAAAKSQRPHNTASTSRPEAQTQGRHSTWPSYQPMPDSLFSTTWQTGAHYLSQPMQNHGATYGYNQQQRQQQQSVPPAMRTFPTPLPSSAMKAETVVAAEDPFVDNDKKPDTQTFQDSDGTISLEDAPADLESPDAANQPEAERVLIRSKVKACAPCKKKKRRCEHNSSNDTSSALTKPDGEAVEATQPKAKKLKASVRENTESENTQNIEPQPTVASDFMSAQAESRRSGDIFSFDDDGKVASFGNGQQNAGVFTNTESPSVEIQYELSTPMGVDTSSMVPNEAEAATKPNKAATKKKSGGRRRKR